MNLSESISTFLCKSNNTVRKHQRPRKKERWRDRLCTSSLWVQENNQNFFARFCIRLSDLFVQRGWSEWTFFWCRTLITSVSSDESRSMIKAVSWFEHIQDRLLLCRIISGSSFLCPVKPESKMSPNLTHCLHSPLTLLHL